MANVLFTLPGKVGDNLCKLPIAYQYSKQFGYKVDLCLDCASRGIIRLLATEPWVDSVFCSAGITDYGMGGQPIDFGRDEEFRRTYEKVFHLGYRAFPTGNLTLCSVNDVPIDRSALLTESCLQLEKLAAKNILLHTESSRRSEDAFTANHLADVLAAGVRYETLQVALFQTTQADPIYDRLRQYNPIFRHCPDMRNIGELARSAVMFTTYSAASCLAYIAKLPVVIVSSNGTELQHFAQLGYVVNDVERAAETLRSKLEHP